MHVRDADKTSDGTLREKNHVCGNATLRAGLVSCVQDVRFEKEMLGATDIVFTAFKSDGHPSNKKIRPDTNGYLGHLDE